MQAISFWLSIHIGHAFWILLTETKESLAWNMSQWFRKKIRVNCTKAWICKASWLHFDVLRLWERVRRGRCTFLTFCKYVVFESQLHWDSKWLHNLGTWEVLFLLMLSGFWCSLVQALNTLILEAFLKITYFGQHHNYVLFAPLWWDQAWNPNTIIIHMDDFEVCAYYQHPDCWIGLHLNVPMSEVQLWAPCFFFLPGWENSTHQLTLEILVLLAGCRWSWATVAP